MNSEQYENLIALLKKALEFYADQRNYDGPMGTISSISSDEYGSQARFALEQIKKLEALNLEAENDFLKNAEALTEEKREEMINNIEIFKQLGGDNNV